jgi:GT2 family glycosyltransferase/glycosyltransferase involved in cell wall biosynthesis/tetratricopeptide (TPR) repeat protein
VIAAERGKLTIDTVDTATSLIDGPGLPSCSEPPDPAANGQSRSKVCRASILILCYNKVELTRKCIAALRENTPEALYELIVVDNASADGTREYLAQLQSESSNTRVLSNQENLGFVGGNNAGASLATTENLVFLNNDTEPQPGWLEALLGAIDADPCAGAVGAKLVYPDGRLQEAGGIIFADASGWNYGRGENPLDPRFNFVREVDYCSGACLLVRRQLFEAGGGFDTRYAPAYYEDTDLCFRVRQAGWRVVYQPASVIIHHEGGTAGTDVQSSFKRYQVVNREKFREKWQALLRLQAPPGEACVPQANDRRRGRRILVVDALMPMYDRASGSRRMFEILRLLAAARHKVTFIARNGSNGQRYARELQQMGIEVYAGDPDRMRQMGYQSDGWRFDLQKLLIERNFEKAFLCFWYIAEQYLPFLNIVSPRTAIYVDTVDVHYVRELRQAELEPKQHSLPEILGRKRRELATYALADALIAVTPNDAAALLKELPAATVKIVPNIHSVGAEVPPFSARQGVLFVGNFVHPPNQDAVMHFHQQIWPRLRSRLPGVPFTIVGNNPPAAVKALAGDGITVTGYVPETEPYLRSHRVSVAPLRYGAGMKGKIGEALALGLPVVTTSIGAEGISSGVNRPFVVEDDPGAFADAVAALYKDERAWGEYSARGRAHIADNFSPAVVEQQLDRLVAEPAPTSIIILACGGLEDTRLCLDSVRRCTAAPYELILVDNGSTDTTAAYFKDYARKHPRVRLILNTSNRGFAGGNNQALSLARGEYVVLLNNDTVVTPGWLEGMMRVFDEHPEVGIVGPMTNYVAGPQLVPKPGYQSLEQLPEFAAQWREAHRGQSQEINRAVGFCLMARRQVLNRIGGLDEAFVNGNFEDDDFCLRALCQGFKVRMAQDVFIHHTGNRTFRNARLDYKRNLLANWEVFKAKWGIAKDTALQHGYRLPLRRASGQPIALRIRSLLATCRPDRLGVVWTDYGLRPAEKKVTMVLPRCALLGALTQPRELRARKRLREAWAATLAAIKARPFHPEAFLLLAEIAQAAGDSASARRCAQHALQLAPGYKPAGKFLRGNLRGNMKPAWLVLPEAMGAGPQAADDSPRLSVCLIAKNEEEFLGSCLASVRGLATQIVVVDTGSADRTVEIAREHGAEVFDFAWCDDFSAARNAALEHVTGDWVLVLDADEELPPESHEPLRRLVQDKSVLGWRLPIVDAGREAEGCSYVPRLFRNAPALFYVGRVHEQIFSSIEVRRQQWGLDNRLGNAPLRHHGYRPEVVKDRNKIQRNLRLLERAVVEMPDEPSLLMSYGLELARSGERERGIVEYFKAVALMSAQPASAVVPELRETLLTQLCTQLMALERWDDMVRLLNSPLAQAGGLTASLHFALGLAHLEQKQFCEAADQMRQCLAKRHQPALAPINQEIHQAGPRHCLALCLDQLRQPETAAQEFRRALQDDPQSRPTRFDFAGFQAAHGQPVEALNLYLALAKEAPDDAQAWLRGGRLALSAPEFHEVALDWTSEAQRHLPEDPAVAHQRAQALTLAGQCEAALPLWRRVAASVNPPGQAQALAAIVLCETASGQDVSAPPAALETSVSREFLTWYQRLVRFNARAALEALNGRLEPLQCAIPSAARLLAAALAQVQPMPTG